MTDERDPGSDGPDTGGFDADAWFRSQFGSPAPEPVVPPAPAPEPPAAQPVPDLPPPVDPFAPVDPFGTFAPPPALVEPPPTLPAVLPVAQPAVLEPEPTQPSAIIEPEPTQPSAIVDAARPLGDAATELMRQPEEGGALDELFGAESFQEYEEALIPAAPRPSRRGSGGEPPAPGEPAPPRAPLGRTQKTLLWVAGALVALLALVAIFFVGTRIPTLLGPAPGAEPSPTATPSPTPTATARPIGPVDPGEYRWDELGGGECLEPYVDAWQDEYTVVDCAEPHGGQLVRRAEFPLAEGELEPGPYPGEEALAAQMSLLCTAPGVLDLAAAGGLTDVQVQGAFPATEEQWDSGARDYFCFASRSSGEPITGSLAPPAPAA
ncbi:MAG: hypothetical protein B7Y93_05090 [Micrococcales bacterium 32-70-13]|nr:MAG: hypothetical protein B7Y93_05090 [Micrococcales bacterium 32-70-13]